MQSESRTGTLLPHRLEGSEVFVAPISDPTPGPSQFDPASKPPVPREGITKSTETDEVREVTTMQPAAFLNFAGSSLPSVVSSPSVATSSRVPTPSAIGYSSFLSVLRTQWLRPRVDSGETAGARHEIVNNAKVTGSTDSGSEWNGTLGGVNAAPAVSRIAESDLRPCFPTPGQDFHGIPNPGPGVRLTLSDLRERLIRQEETIIFALIERAQFRLNKMIYVPDAFKIPGFTGTFSKYLLYEVEKAYAKVRRYTSPDEHAFSPPGALPDPLLPELSYPPTLVQNDINCNQDVERVYLSSILPAICEEGDDQNYGSAAACDVACLQALSKRVHYGKFIAEAKYAAEPQTYSRLARAGDRDGLWALLSDIGVERVLLARVENKARNYGVDVTDGGTGSAFKVDPMRIMEIYRDFIIPLTKVVEVDYLMVRYLIDEPSASAYREQQR